MKVYEMKPNEIGEAVETTDAIIVMLHNPDRVLIISRKDMVVKDTRVESIKETTSLRGDVVTRLGHGRYPLTIIYRTADGRFYELFSGKQIHRTRNFYKKDKNGFYYIPEISGGESNEPGL